jgi:transglutaminase-like putative cysteine protease
VGVAISNARTAWRLPALIVLFGAAFSSHVLAAALHERVDRGPVPEWVDPVEADPAESPVETVDGQPVTFLLVDRQVRLPESGAVESYLHFILRINSRAALEDWSSWEFDFEPSYQRVVVHDVEILRDGTRRDRFETSRKSVLQRESDLTRHVFDQTLTLLVIFDDVRVGDVVSVSYTVIGSNPVFGDRWAGSYSLGWGSPVDRQRVRFLAHDSRSPHFKVNGGEIEPAVRRLESWTETTFASRDVEAFDFEIDAPLEWFFYPVVHVSEFDSWAEVAEWAVPLYFSDEGPGALKEVAEQIRSATEDPAERTILARDWVQDEIRYFAVLMGEHSHAPHRPSEIVTHRYGDCKDKTVALISLLRLLDVDAWPALVSVETGVGAREWLPSPDAFDHVIVVARPGDEEIWIDPTLTLQGGVVPGDLYVPPYEAALIVRPGESSLTPVPETQSDPGRSRIVYSYELPESIHPVKTRIVSEYERSEAESMREALAGLSTDEIVDDYIEFYSSYATRVEVAGKLEIDDDRRENRLRVTERYEIEQDIDEATGIAFETLPLLMDSDLGLPDSYDRTSPLAVPYPHRRVEVVELRVPAGWTLEPVTESQENEWFRFSARSKRLNPGLEITYTLETLTDRVDQPDLREYGAAVQEMIDSLGYAVMDSSTGDQEVYAIAALLFGGMTAVSVAIALLVIRRRARPSRGDRNA